MLSTQRFVLALYIAALGIANQAIAERPSMIEFDLSPVAVAQTVPADEGVFVPDGYRWVRLSLDISSLIDSPAHSKPHEFLYQIRCSSSDSRVVDYSPRTRLSETAIGGIQIEQSDERSKNLGLGVKSSYLGLVHGNGGADLGSKVYNKTKFEKVAPQEIVYAGGTIDRGQGVYFKLRSTPTHVLDGQKRFTITLQVPDAWRGDLLTAKLSVAESLRSFPSLERESVVTSRTRFQVAVFDQSDEIARRWAWQLAEAEQSLRETASRRQDTIRDRSLPTIFHHVAAALDVIEPKISDDWLQRTLYGSIDPYFDKQIRQLPVDVKVAVLDYLESKSKFQGLVRSLKNSQEAHSGLAAK